MTRSSHEDAPLSESRNGRVLTAAALAFYYGVACRLPDLAFPGGRGFNAIRCSALRAVLSELGDDNEIDSHVYVGDGRGVTIGSHCQINSGCRLSRVVVADHVMIGPEVIVVGRLHRVDDVDIPMADQGEYTKPHTRIESDVWVGVRAIIMPGVTIGTGSIVGAGAVVTRDVAPWTVVGGAPARVIRERRPART